MHTATQSTIERLELGAIQQFKNMMVFPLFTPGNGGPEYLTLKEALDRRLLTITEKGEGGTVPELKAVNKGDLPILLLDGEEVKGAKQNRVLNATILLREHSETIIPVSCTEEGRWSYISPEFGDSDLIMARRVRNEKSRTVHANLRVFREYRSDQGQVWEDIAHMAAEVGVRSPTGAMRDIYASSEESLGSYLEAFPLQPNQKGLLVVINGAIAGFDLVSLEQAHANLHRKLLKSYAMDALVEAKKAPANGEEITGGMARAFFDIAAACKEETYQSVGYGMDHRYEGRSVVGSALIYLGTVIHMAFFTTRERDTIGRMAGFRTRRGYRG